MIDAVTERALCMFLERIRPRYDVAEAILFGSRARGDHGPDSDADLMVVLRGRRQNTVGITLAMSDIAFDVLMETGLDIAPLPVWQNELLDPEHHPNPDLVRTAMKEGITIVKPEDLLAKAARAMASAKLLLEADDMDGACNRAYYAMFDAARAALLSAGLKLGKSHQGSIGSAFYKLLQSKELSEDLGRSLKQAESARYLADYEGHSVPVVKAREIVTGAEKFVTAMTTFVTAQIKKTVTPPSGRKGRGR
jgi:uncharacterized protein (UPF0332 family)/predicted nucleotidyltransferase